MTQVADYLTDYGKELRYYPHRIDVDSRNGNLLLVYLPERIISLFSEEDSSFTGCKNGNIEPRYLEFNFVGEVLIAEIPQRLTNEEIISVKSNSGATSIRYVGESINYSELKWLADLTTQ